MALAKSFQRNGFSDHQRLERGLAGAPGGAVGRRHFEPGKPHLTPVIGHESARIHRRDTGYTAAYFAATGFVGACRRILRDARRDRRQRTQREMQNSEYDRSPHTVP